MKLSKIATLCRSKKVVCLAENEAGLWLGTTEAMYALPEFAGLTQDGICTALGISQADRAKYIFRREAPPPELLVDSVETDRVCERLDIVLYDRIPFIAEDGILFLRREMLAPLKDEMEQVEIFSRRIGRETKLVAKCGLFIVATFEPDAFLTPGILEKLNILQCLCAVCIENSCEPKTEGL